MGTDEVGLFVELAKTYGLFAAMFIVLLGYVLWDGTKREKRSSEREERYIAVIDTQSREYANLYGMAVKTEELTKDTQLDVREVKSHVLQLLFKGGS